MRSTVRYPVLLAVLLAAGLTAEAACELVEIQVPAPSLAGNLLGDPTEQPVMVYLPPGYDTAPQKRYPAFYLLHGFNDHFRPWGQGLARAMDTLVSAAAVQEMIVVVPNGRNAYLSSYFTSSPVTGNWEGFLVRDLVDAIDGRFRTLPQPESRGIAGHSKGGFAALRLAMRHPDRFGAVYALSPCCLSIEDAVAAASDSVWRRALGLRSRAEMDALVRKAEADATEEELYTVGVVALAAAFSPNPGRPPLFVDLPVREGEQGTRPDPEVRARWHAESPVHAPRELLANLARLRGVAIDYGLQDHFEDLPLSVRAFSDALAAAGVPHAVEAYEGGHEDRLPGRVTQHLLPFFSRTLAAAAAP